MNAEYQVTDTEQVGDNLFITFEPVEEIRKENLSGNATTMSLPRQGGTEFEEAMARITKQFTDTTKALTEERNVVKRRTVGFQQTFTGQSDEDPELFLRKLDKYFRSADVQDEDEKIAIFEAQLRGEAKTWRVPYQRLEEGYTEVCYRFLKYFNSPDKISMAMSALYGEKQEREKVIPFMVSKQGLIARLIPEMKIGARIELILNQLHTEIRSRLRGVRFFEIEELMTAAENIEKDLALGQNANTNRNSGASGNFRNVGPSHELERRPPSPCRYCGEWHFHQQCRHREHRQNGPPLRREEGAAPEPNWN